MLEFTGQYFADWEPGDDPVLVAVDALETAYADPAADLRADVAEQIAFLYKQLGRTAEVHEWRARAAADARGASSSAKAKPERREVPGITVPAGRSDALPGTADAMAAAAPEDSARGVRRSGGQEVALTVNQNEHVGAGGALVPRRGQGVLAAGAARNGACARLAPTASAATTWQQRARDLAALRRRSGPGAAPLPLALTPPPRWARYVDVDAQHHHAAGDEVGRQGAGSAHALPPSASPDTGAARQPRIPSASRRARSAAAGERWEGTDDASEGASPRKDATGHLERVRDVHVRGRHGYLQIDPPPRAASAGDAWKQASGGSRGGTVPLPSRDGALFDMRSPATGQTLEGVEFSEGGRVVTRTDSKDPPVVTWASSLLTGASPGAEGGGGGGAARGAGGGCWALQVTRQTGRFMVGFAKAPLSEDYGFVLDMVSDGCVVGNFGAVYRTQSEALVNDALANEELTFEDLPKLHRLAITKKCERQAACVAGAVSPADQGGALAFGTDSIIILELDVSNSTGVGRGGVGADGHRTATARFHLLQAELLASTAAGGRVFTGAGGDTCLPAGKLRAIRSFSVAGVPADAVPFVNMEGPGDSAALLNARMCRREIRWLVDPMSAKGRRRPGASEEANVDDLRQCIQDAVRERKSRQLRIGDRRGRVTTGCSVCTCVRLFDALSSSSLPPASSFAPAHVFSGADSACCVRQGLKTTTCRCTPLKKITTAMRIGPRTCRPPVEPPSQAPRPSNPQLGVLDGPQ